MKSAVTWMIAITMGVPLVAQTTASQLVNLRHRSGHGVEERKAAKPATGTAAPHAQR